MEIRFIPDRPIDYIADSLKFLAFAETLQKAIFNTRPPFAYGVLGDWGSGKTSILNLLTHLLEEKLKDQHNQPALFVPIRFDAWKYESEDNLVFPLLHTIRADYEQRVGKANQLFLERFKQAALTGTLALTDVALRTATKALTGEASSVEDLAGIFDRLQSKAGAVENVLSGWANQVDSLYDAFARLLDCYAEDFVARRGQSEEKSQVRFVILIDDLDRCLPQTVIKILESIKNYLLTENCIFILALNPQVVYQGIRVKYAGLNVDGREYLEKILNYSFYVPEPLPEQVEAFAREELKKLVDPGDQARLESDFDKFAQVIRDCNFTNPRKVKRILNHYLFFLNLPRPDLSRYNMSTVVRFIVLAEYFPALFQLFVKDAEEARTALKDINKDQFDPVKFEGRFGIEIKSLHPQMRYMHRLFDLSPITDNARASLTDHARAVFQIVHHPI